MKSMLIGYGFDCPLIEKCFKVRKIEKMMARRRKEERSKSGTTMKRKRKRKRKLKKKRWQAGSGGEECVCCAPGSQAETKPTPPLVLYRAVYFIDCALPGAQPPPRKGPSSPPPSFVRLSLFRAWHSTARAPSVPTSAVSATTCAARVIPVLSVRTDLAFGRRPMCWPRFA